MGSKKSTQTKSSDTRAFESQLWEACEAQRGSVNASRYKHPVLGLVFLKYVNDNFEHYRTDLATKLADPADDYYFEDESGRLAVLEDRDEYLAHNVFWIPTEARWVAKIRDQAAQNDIATRIDNVMEAIERENPVLKGVLPKSFAASEIPQRNLTALIGIVDGITFGREDHDGRDRLGQVYEYFLGKFSGVEGRAGEDYTPRSVVDLLVEMLEPYKGRIYDPCCGSGGMFVQSRKFLAAHGGTGGDISVFGQESNAETWRLAKMNLALHGIDGNLGDRADSSFTADLHPDLRADFIIANPPFNLGEKGRIGWGRERVVTDPRWTVGGQSLLPPATNANFAWILHFLHHLAPNGYAGFVISNGALSNTNRVEEVAIRKALVEANNIDCVVALPGKLFANTPIPVSLCFMAKNRGKSHESRDRRGEVLFINATSLGHQVSSRQWALSPADVQAITSTYKAFRRDDGALAEAEIPSFSRVVKQEEIKHQEYVLHATRYVGTTSLAIESDSPRERLEASASLLIQDLNKFGGFSDALRFVAEAVLKDPGAQKPLSTPTITAARSWDRTLLLMDRMLTSMYEDFSQESTGEVPLGDLFEQGLGGVWGNDSQTGPDEVLVACLRGIDLANLADGRLPTPPLRWVTSTQAERRNFADGELWLEGSGSFCGRSMLITKGIQTLFVPQVRYSNFVKRLVPRDDFRHAFPAWIALRSAFATGEMANYRTGSAFPNLDLPGLMKNFMVSVLPAEKLERLWDLAQLRLSPELVRASVLEED